MEIPLERIERLKTTPHNLIKPLQSSFCSLFTSSFFSTSKTSKFSKSLLKKEQTIPKTMPGIKKRIVPFIPNKFIKKAV